jgi:hypothetical protein
VVGAFATNHQPQVLPPYFAARKKNPASFVSIQRKNNSDPECMVHIRESLQNDIY